MYRKVLVALDSSELQSSVFAEALDLAKATGAGLMLLHVLSAFEEGSPGVPIRSYHTAYPVLDESTWAVYQDRWHDYEQRGIEQLRARQQQAEKAGVAAEFTQTSGEPPRLICELAGTWEADLIVVGSHGRRGISEILLGSVSNYVMHHAPCSVLVVHGSQTQKAEGSDQLAEAVSG
ncbi:universal stress protein [filamentous cyanobacterium CCP5]|nr:universal stress protein [filamentous cyanobacterium CCP5]